MRIFHQRELKAALAHATAGGQSLHLVSGVFAHHAGAPGVFRHCPEFAHLFDQDVDRLVLTAKSLGVRVIKVERPGLAGQHIDLCNKPLHKARDLCATPEFELA